MTELTKTKLITIAELSKILNVDRTTILRAIEKYNLCSSAKVLVENGKTTFLNETQTTEIKKIIQNHHNLASRNIDNISTRIEEDNKIKEVLNILLRREEENKELLRKKEEEIQEKNKIIEDLEEREKERLYIENEKYKTKELRTKINKIIKRIAKDRFNNNYKDTWNYFFNKYNNIHCFNNSTDLNIIQERGHLKEFYNILLNN